MQLEIEKLHTERHWMQDEMKFEIYPLFGMIFGYRIDRKIQMVLAKCMDS